MKHLRIFLVVAFSVVACSLHAKKAKPDPIKPRKGPNPYVEIDVPARILALIDKADDLNKKIEYYDNQALDGKKSAEKKAKKLIEDRKKLAEDVEKVIEASTKKENREVDKLNKDIEKMEKRIESLKDDDEKKIADMSDKKMKLIARADALTDIADKYKMFTEYCKGGRSDKTPYGLLKAMTPDFKGKTLGEAPEDYEFKGMQENYVILVFFAVEHKGSYKMLGDMLGVARSAKQAEIVAVSMDHNTEEAEKFVKSKKPKFPVIGDPTGVIGAKFNVSFLPQVLLVGPDGTVHRVLVGASGKAKNAIKNEIRDQIKKAKEEAK